jgi:hypothetical protein
MNGQAEPKTLPTTYVVKRGEPIDKYMGYKKLTSYTANEQLGVCDCISYSYRESCKHLVFKDLLDQFKVNEFVFFGNEIGECRPRTKEDIIKLADSLKEVIKSHFMYDSLELVQLIQNPTNSDLYNSVTFEGVRARNVLVVGYVRGILFRVLPVAKKAEPVPEEKPKQEGSTSVRVDF